LTAAVAATHHNRRHSLRPVVRQIYIVLYSVAITRRLMLQRLTEITVMAANAETH
jgi:hypothetical protein